MQRYLGAGQSTENPNHCIKGSGFLVNKILLSQTLLYLKNPQM